MAAGALIHEMIKYLDGDMKRIQHFLKVYAYAKSIGEEEQLDERTQFILETAAITHDIGIKVCEEKYQSTSGKLQEQEGPALAKLLLERLEYEREVVDRVCYLIGHHHTYTAIEGLDYQILVEADFLVNLAEEESSRYTIDTVKERIFKTETGKDYMDKIFSKIS